MSFKLAEHNIQCIIGPKSGVNELAKCWVYAELLDLTNAFGLIPLTFDLIADMDELADEGEDRAYKEFIFLTKSVEAVLKENSYTEPIGYIETDYRVGQGTQTGIAYLKGNVIEGPIMTKTFWDEKEMKFIDSPAGTRAIDKVLYALGLAERKDMNGFDNLGLGDYRSNNKILKNL